MKTIALILLLTLTGCHGYQVHPGAINQFDSSVYDALIAAKTTIAVAREQMASGALTERVKPQLNALITAYNVAYPVYLAWHQAVEKGAPADEHLTALNRNMTELNRTLTAFKSGGE